ncbi:MAG: N-acetylmuramidase family protein [Burkholderiales bacterium]|nr:N-acetylmuramidase family protein [Burkholderiales bacterium]MDE2394546.1 N-acetylmuramidase family protein [Burkholderiales bacterium]MDE2452169.1 N-acetylmuramidase family protein [Burkholderiales bacterium]
MTAQLESSVGKTGLAANRRPDVMQVQQLLNAGLVPTLGPGQVNPAFLALGLGRIPPFAALVEDGRPGPGTTAAIVWFQRNVIGASSPDGVVSASGATLRVLVNPPKQAQAAALVAAATSLPDPGSAAAISEKDYAAAAAELGVEVAAVKAVARVESARSGFIDDGRPIIRFEAHVFSRATRHFYDPLFPMISVRQRNDSLVMGGESGLRREYDRLASAMALDRDAALASTSWGLFQLMGFNFAAAGFGSVSDMVSRMYLDEGEHLAAFARFVKKKGYAGYLKDKAWGSFAYHYNGPDYGNYDDRMQTAYEEFSAVEK